MLKTLVKKELLDSFLSLRFMVSSVIVVFIMVLSTVVLMQDYANKRDSFNQNMRKHFEHAEEHDNYLELMFSGVSADRPPAELQMFYTGVEKNPNRNAMIFPFFKPRYMGELNINPVFPLFPAVDLLFVVSIVMSLIAFVFSYDAVCGERERGTLKLLMSYAIPRDYVILAKWIGGYISLIVSYLAGVVLCALIVQLNPRVDISGLGWEAFILTVLVSMLFIGVMYSVGLFVSVWSKRSATAISILLFIWVIFVLIIPNSVPFIVDKIKPIDSPSMVMSRIKKDSGSTIEDLVMDTISAFEQATGITVDQVDFGRDEDQYAEESRETESTGSAQASSSSSSSSSSQAGGSGGGAPQMPEGMDMSRLTEVAGEITDSDLRDIRLKGCERWVGEKIKQEFGVTLDQAVQMAEEMGYDIDVKSLLRQCEEQKKNLGSMSAEELARQQAAQAPAVVQKPKPEPKKEKVSMNEVISRYMNLSRQEKAAFIDKMYQSFITMNERNSNISAREEEKYARDVQRQVDLTKNLSRISPVSAYIYAVTDLANTGIEREKHLKEYLWRYQEQFLDFLRDKFTADDSERIHSIFGGFFREPEYNLDDMPRFRYQPMDLAERLKYAMVDIVVLFAFALIFFILAYMSFLRAEIID